MIREVILMSLSNCQCRCNCTTLAVIASVIIGVAVALLTLTSGIAVSTPLLWAFFGIAVAFLAVLLGVFNRLRGENTYDCVCSTLVFVIAGILGTILFSLILITVDIAAASILGAIITGLLFLFFALIITTTACLVKCLARCR